MVSSGLDRNLSVPSPYAFGGGLDQTSTAIAIPAGRAIAAMNYEPVVTGYARVTGHERYDGRLPSENSFFTLGFDAGTVQVVAGDVITGVTSAATGKVLVAPYGITGTWGGGDAAGTLVLVAVTGTFLDNEVLNVAAAAHAHVNGTIGENVGPTADLEDTWAAAAQDYMRGLISDVPGAGPVRGGFVFNGIPYAFRDNIGATQGRMWKATATGWVQQTFGKRIRFNLGLVEIAEGATITGATSGATAHVERVIVKDGEFGAPDVADQALGNLIISGQAGNFTAGEIIKVGATNSATNANGGDSSAILLPAGGRYMSKVKNFYGATNRKRVYCVNGVGTGFEYDGASVLVPIETGTPTDRPERVFDIANHLGFTFPGGSIQVSEPGEPCVFNAILGAAEIGMGDDVTDVVDATDTAVVFFARDKVAILTGRGVDTFVFEELTEEAGALAWTAQRIGRTVYLDLRGLRDLAATAAFGNFKAGALSELFDRFLKAKRSAGAQPVASIRCKTKSQYRLYYDDGTGFTVFMGGKTPQMLPFETDSLRVSATFTGELADGSEGMFACGENGFVYRIDSGTNFDGVGVRGFVMTPFNHVGQIRKNKRFQTVDVELEAAPRTRLGILAQFDYGDGEQPVSGNQDFTVAGLGHDFIVSGGGGFWDEAVWSDFYWSGAYQGMAEADIAGAGRNISIIFAAQSGVVEPPHTLESYLIHWLPRGDVKRTAL